MMTGKEAFDFIKGFTYFQNGCYKTELEAIKQDLDRLEKLKSEIQTRIDTLQKRQEYLNNCLGDMECYIEYNFNIKKLELLFELKKVLEDDK